MGLLRLEPDYVFNHLTLEEFSLIYEGYFEGFKDSWEKVRLTCFALAQYRTEKDIKTYMPFSWDKPTETPPAEPSTVEDFNRMKELLTNLNLIN